MLVLAIVIAGLLLIVAVVAVWQVAAEDRAGRAATAERVTELVRNEGLSVAAIAEWDGTAAFTLRPRDQGLASSVADSTAGEDHA